MPPSCVAGSVCLTRYASSSAGARLAAWPRCGRGGLQALGGFCPRGRGGSQGAREPRGAVGLEQEPRDCREPRGCQRLHGLGTQLAILPERAGARSALWRRVETAGCGLRCGRGCSAPESLKVSASSAALPALPGSSPRVSGAHGRSDSGLVLGHGAPARTPVWVPGVGGCLCIWVSVCQ